MTCDMNASPASHDASPPSLDREARDRAETTVRSRSFAVPALVVFGLLLASILGRSAPAAAQDSNILHPVDEVEEMLRSGQFEVAAMRDMRAPGDRTQFAALSFGEGNLMNTQWAVAPPGGETFNNVPRYELAAYEIQKLFLDEAEYVVPPTVVRCFPVDWYRQHKPDVDPTFSGTNSVLTVIQYFLWNTQVADVWDKKRFQEDEAYARHVANMNVLTYLIRHSDSNEGNFLISQDPENPRVFSVDNGVSFDSDASTRGTFWRNMRVDRIPQATAERLREITRQDLHGALATLVQLQIGPDGTLAPVDRTQPLGRGRIGVRREGEVIQLGLTTREIDAVQSRLERLVRDLDEGKLGVF